MRTTDIVTTAKPGDAPVAPDRGTESAATSPEFLFDASLSTAIAAAGERQAESPMPAGPLTPEMLDKMHRYWRAANYLCVGQIYLREPAPTRTAQCGADQTDAARALGNLAGSKPHLRSPESPHQRTRREHHLRLGSRARWSVAQRGLVPRRLVYRSPPGSHPRRRRTAASLSAILDSRRRAEPLRTARPEFHA